MIKKILYLFNRFLVPNIEAKKTNRWWWLPFTYPFLFIFIGILFFMLYLSYSVKKFREVEVPILQNKSIEEAKIILQKLELMYNVIDTLNNGTLPDNTVISQYPDSKMKVKKGRTIMLSISSKKEVPIQMLNVVGLGLSNAVYMIRLQNLNVRDTLWQASDEAKYIVLKQLYKNKPIAEGKQLNKNAGITLVVSSGSFQVNEQEVPNLIGLSVEEAKMILQQFRLSIGTIHSEKNNSVEYIYRQFPQAGVNEIGKPLTMKQNGNIEIWTSIKIN
ncbi:MAG: PASTA domain-containing protein [Chitinophagaceae bacterium]